MIIPTEEQVIERWDELPDSLKDALVSDANSALIWKTAEAEHIPNEKIYTVATAVSQVLYGFIHPEDISTELKAAQFNPQTVVAIVGALNQKIFAPIQQDLNKAYRPIAGATIPVQDIKATQVTIPVGPKIIAENFTAKPITPPKPAFAPRPPAKPQQVTSQAVPISAVNSTLAPLNKNVATPTAPVSKPAANTNDKGWSRQGSQDPVIKLGVITPNIPAPKPAAAPVKTPTPTTTTPVKTMSEFERLDMQKKGTMPPSSPIQPLTSSTTQMPTPAPKAPEPAPVMLHQINMPAGNEKTQNFQINGGMQNQMGRVPNQVPMPNRPAVLEFGTPSAASSALPTSPTPQQPQKMAPAMSAGPRQITEITAQPPKPPIPPATPMPQSKVVVKDYR